MRTYTAVDEHGNRVACNIQVSSPAAQPYYSIIPSPAIPGYQGPHAGQTGSHGTDNWSSLSYLAAGTAGNPTGRDVYVLEESDGTYTDPTRGLLEANSASNSEFNTAGREATEMARFPGASVFYPGAHFFIRQSFWIPSPFTANVGHYTLHEFFGFPLHLPTFQIGVFFGTSLNLLMLSCDMWNQAGNPPTSVNFTNHNFGKVPLDCWHDIVLEVQCNTLRMGDATGKVNGGTTSQWIPNNDGWYRAWYTKQPAGSSFVQGPLLPLVNTTGSLSRNPNYPNGVPAIDAQGNVPPPGAIGSNWIQPQMNCPLTGTAWNFGYWTFGYTDQLSLSNAGKKGYLKHFVDSTVCGPTLASIGL